MCPPSDARANNDKMTTTTTTTRGGDYRAFDRLGTALSNADSLINLVTFKILSWASNFSLFTRVAVVSIQDLRVEESILWAPFQGSLWVGNYFFKGTDSLKMRLRDMKYGRRWINFKENCQICFSLVKLPEKKSCKKNRFTCEKELTESQNNRLDVTLLFT